MPILKNNQKKFLEKIRHWDNDPTSVMCNAAYNYPMPDDLSYYNNFYRMLTKILYARGNYTERQGEVINEFIEMYRDEIESELNGRS